MIRKIVKIDEELCNGCGLCVPSCAEGAIKVIDGKARLVSEVYCDGLGNCLGECPQGAISIEEREADAFDPEAVEEMMASQKKPAAPAHAHSGGCPGSLAQMLKPQIDEAEETDEKPSALGNWPVQLSLVPLQAPYYQNANLLIAADCVPFAYHNFHQKFLARKTLLIGCPKLDDAQHYYQKLTEIFTRNQIKSIEIAYMEVPCCFGLVALIRQAVQDSQKSIPITLSKIGIRGNLIESKSI